MAAGRQLRSMILFTADWHIKLGQKNVPTDWAINRYNMFFEQITELESDCDLHIIGGDLFDRVPSMDELSLYFDFVKGVSVRTIIFDGNHEATRKNKTFFTNLKRATTSIATVTIFRRILFRKKRLYADTMILLEIKVNIVRIINLIKLGICMLTIISAMTPNTII